VVSLQQGPFVDRFPDPVVVHTTGARVSMARGALQLRRHLRRTRPDLVHANGVKAAVVAVVAAWRTGIPVVWVKHDFSWDGRLARVVARRCAEVVGVSSTVLASVPDGVPTSVVPPGIALPDVQRSSEARAGTVALVGRLHSVKGHLELLAAVPDVLARCPGARFLVVGGEDPSQLAYARTVRDAAAPFVAAGVVELTGHRTDVVQVIADADVLVVPSVVDDRGFGLEASPLVAIEAMAVGTPVVGYAAGGVPELLGDCGVLVPLGDRQALAKAIAELLEDADRRRALGECGRDRVRERFTADRMAQGLRAVYQRVAARASRTMGA
jgi:glycosyltransferase involved in cell wall biosynthesis